MIISAEEDFRDIYKGINLKEKFKRTISRLIEMQSKDYLKEAHKA
jgi:cell division protein ZapE